MLSCSSSALMELIAQREASAPGSASREGLKPTDGRLMLGAAAWTASLASLALPFTTFGASSWNTCGRAQTLVRLRDAETMMVKAQLQQHAGFSCCQVSSAPSHPWHTICTQGVASPAALTANQSSTVDNAARSSSGG